MHKTSPLRLRFQILAFSFARTVINTGLRMIYAFLPVLAQGLGVSHSAIAMAVMARSSLAVASPWISSAALQRGYKHAMLMGLMLLAGGFALVPIWPTYWVFFLALLLSSVAKVLLDPATQAYLSDQVAYARRGRAIALMEISWSASFLVGVPIAGWLIAGSGWKAPFPFLAVLAASGAAVLGRMLPSDRASASYRLQPKRRLWQVLSQPQALAALAVGLLVATGAELVGIVYAVWLEDAFGLQVLALGATSIMIGFAEFGGEGLVAGIADRLGKRRAVALGLLFNGISCLSLPVLGRSLPGAMAGMFLFFLGLEFAIVSNIVLISELIPGSRVALLAANVSVFSAGRALGAFVGPSLYALGMWANCAVAALMTFAALAIVQRLIHTP